MKNKTITIFGGSGFLGKEIVSHLSTKGFILKVFGRSYEKLQTLKLYGSPGQISIYAGNINNLKNIDNIISGSDYIINLIAVLSEFRSQSFDNLHVKAPQNIATVSIKHGIKQFIQISSIGADLESLSYNSRSRAQGENELKSIIPNDKLTIIRPSIIFGENDHFFFRFAKLSNLTPFLPLPGGGRTKFQPVFVKDIAISIEKIISNVSYQGKVYELGGPKIFSWKELMQFLNKNLLIPRLLISIPFQLLSMPAFFMSFLPKPILTLDQIKQLKLDNVVSEDYFHFDDLDIKPRSLEMEMPKYLSQLQKIKFFNKNKITKNI